MIPTLETLLLVQTLEDLVEKVSYFFITGHRPVNHLYTYLNVEETSALKNKIYANFVSKLRSYKNLNYIPEIAKDTFFGELNIKDDDLERFTSSLARDYNLSLATPKNNQTLEDVFLKLYYKFLIHQKYLDFSLDILVEVEFNQIFLVEEQIEA